VLILVGFRAVVAADTVVVSTDLLELFPKAEVVDALVCEVQRPARSGNVAEHGLYQHPRDTQRPARVTFPVGLPAIGRDDLLLMAFAIGIADGARFDAGEDGVRFRVEVGERPLFSQEWRECRWLYRAVDLSDYAGRRIQLSFLVDALDTPNHDWALWGCPRLLQYRGVRGRDRTDTAGPYGALAVKKAPQASLTVRLDPIDRGLPQEWLFAANPGQTNQDSEWFAMDFGLTAATGVKVRWDPTNAAEDVWLGSFEPRPVFMNLTAAQASSSAGSTIHIRGQVRNEGRGYLAAAAGLLQLMVGDEPLPAQSLPGLGPGETGSVDWTWQAPKKPGVRSMQAKLIVPSLGLIQDQTAPLELLSPVSSINTEVLSNRFMRLEFIRTDKGYAYANIWVRQGLSWMLAGVWRPLMRVVLETPAGERDWEIRPRSFTGGRSADRSRPAASLAYQEVVRDPQGIPWAVALRIRLAEDRPIAEVHYEWQPSAERGIKALWGPNLYPGEGTTGEAKSGGLFPGMEFLHGPEPSSNARDFAPPLQDRRTPDPLKITIPLMAIAIAPRSPAPTVNPDRFYCPDSTKDHRGDLIESQNLVTLGLFWNPLQAWDDLHPMPATRFSSPNLDEGMRNHRLGLFLPSAPEWVAENADRAGKPYRAAPAQILKLDATLVAAPGPVMVAMREWYQVVGGVPYPHPWPRSFQEELTVCREGFLRTVWDVPGGKWRHCIDWPSSHTPGFATLLWWDAHLAEAGADRARSAERVELAARNMLQESGPGVLVSTANCHILRWEFPFLYGHLTEAMSTLESHMRELAKTQTPDGGWVYKPANDAQKNLGAAGDAVLGTTAHHASTLLRYARITGDQESWLAGAKALAFMERFRVPRGGQTWECPMYQPDILPAAQAIAACLDGYRISQNPRWLQDAVYWAETGLPFVYQWTVTNRPMMLGATIPVFGSTFYTHSWLGTPVQWCGLVYSHSIWQLAEQLSATPLATNASVLPVTLGFQPPDWRRVAELITTSALHQQFDQGDRIGTYPDSISRFEQRNPAFINPEGILVNVLALKGQPTDIQTVRLMPGSEELVISTGATIQKAEVDAGSRVRFQLRFFPDETSQVLVSGISPRAVWIEGQPLTRSSTPLGRAPGWYHDAKRRWTFLGVPHAQPTVNVELEP
jgi:hypothetical protein